MRVLLCSALLGLAAAGAAHAEPRITSPQSSPQCAPTTFRVYFEPDSASLNQESRALLRLAGREVSACDAVQVSVASSASDPAARAQQDAVLRALRQQTDANVVLAEGSFRPVPGAGVAPSFVEVQAIPLRG